MIIQGKTHPKASVLSNYLSKTGQNEKAELKEVYGTVANDIKGALFEMELIASGTRCKNHMYHVSINPRENENLTPEQWARAIDLLAENLRLDGHQRVVVEHIKEGRQHMHVAWSRIDIEKMTAVRLSKNYKNHELTARQLEKEFGHTRVQGVHIEREGKRPFRAFSNGDLEKLKRLGINILKMREESKKQALQIKEKYAFIRILKKFDLILAYKDENKFVLVDLLGKSHQPIKLIKSLNVRELQSVFQEIGIKNLPPIEKAKENQASIRKKRQIGLEANKVRQNNKENRAVVNESQMDIGHEREIEM